MYFLPLHAVLSKGVSHAHVPAMWPAGSNPCVDVICGLSLLLVLSLVPGGFSPGTLVLRFPLKPTLSNSNSIWNAGTRFNEFLRTPKCSVEAGISTTRKISPVFTFLRENTPLWTQQIPLLNDYKQLAKQGCCKQP